MAHKVSRVPVVGEDAAAVYPNYASTDAQQYKHPPKFCKGVAQPLVVDGRGRA
jgi:hypothetical protein